jgi:hypothetical protein
MDPRTAERWRAVCVVVAIVQGIGTVLFFLLAKIFVGGLGVVFLSLWYRLTIREVGRRRAVAILGLAVPAVIWSVLLVVVARNTHLAGGGVNAFAVFVLMVQAFIGVVGAIAAGVVPSGVFPPIGPRPPQGFGPPGYPAYPPQAPPGYAPPPGYGAYPQQPYGQPYAQPYPPPYPQYPQQGAYANPATATSSSTRTALGLIGAVTLLFVVAGAILLMRVRWETKNAEGWTAEVTGAPTGSALTVTVKEVPPDADVMAALTTLACTGSTCTGKIERISVHNGDPTVEVEVYANGLRTKRNIPRPLFAPAITIGKPTDGITCDVVADGDGAPKSAYVSVVHGLAFDATGLTGDKLGVNGKAPKSVGQKEFFTALSSDLIDTMRADGQRVIAAIPLLAQNSDGPSWKGEMRCDATFLASELRSDIRYHALAKHATATPKPAALVVGEATLRVVGSVGSVWDAQAIAAIENDVIWSHDCTYGAYTLTFRSIAHQISVVDLRKGTDIDSKRFAPPSPSYVCPSTIPAFEPGAKSMNIDAMPNARSEDEWIASVVH